MSERWAIRIDGTRLALQRDGRPFLYSEETARAWAALGNAHDPADNAEPGHTYEAIPFDDDEEDTAMNEKKKKAPKLDLEKETLRKEAPTPPKGGERYSRCSDPTTTIETEIPT